MIGVGQSVACKSVRKSPKDLQKALVLSKKAVIAAFPLGLKLLITHESHIEPLALGAT